MYSKDDEMASDVSFLLFVHNTMERQPNHRNGRASGKQTQLPIASATPPILWPPVLKTLLTAGRK
jgi:hypothetical protein